MNANVDNFIPAPAELSEHDLETVSGGTTPAAPVAGGIWLAVEIAGVVAGAAAVVIGTVSQVHKTIADNKQKEREKNQPTPQK